MASIYTVGGAVQAFSGLYIERAADRELLDLCRRGVFAYVLSARQMGKSSLMVSTAERLAREGARSVIVDLEKFGTQATAEAWYVDMLDEIADQLDLQTDVVEWWQARDHFGMAHRLADFFREVLLAEIDTRVVIFVDEIDTTLSLPFADDFYAAVRSLHEARAREPDLKRLSFVLIGVATPGDLIRDPKRTPFNIGQRVDLVDFGLKEAMPLAEGFGMPKRPAERLLRRVLFWTHGHPYLTQRLCRTIAEQRRSNWSKRDVAKVVASTFFGEKSRHDNNLQFVRDMLTRRAPDQSDVLNTYRRIRHRRPVRDEEQSVVKSHLKLSGVVRRENDVLRVRNPIYEAVFDDPWIREHLPTTWPERLRRLRRIAVAIIVPLFFLSLALGGYASYLAVNAENDRQVAVNAQQTAVAAQTTAELARATAEALRNSAENAKAQAIDAQQSEKLLRSQIEIRALLFAMQTTPDPELGLMIAIEGAERDPENPVLVQALREAILRSPLRSVLRGHTADLTSAAFSPDGDRIVTASYDTSARIWNWRSIVANTTVTIADSTNGLTSAVFSPDGRYVATSGQDTQVHIAAAGTGAAAIDKPLRANSEPVYSVAFSPDGQFVVTASRDSTARVWDWRAKALVAELRGHKDLINSVAFSADSQFVVTASRDKTARVWSWDTTTRTYAPVTILSGHSAGVYSAAFSQDGEYILTASQDGTARIWPRSGGKPLQILRENDTSPPLYSAAFSPDGAHVATASIDGTAQIWEWRTGKQVSKLVGHTARIWTVSFSPDGKHVVTASADGTARVWDAGIISDTTALPSSMDELLALAQTRVTRTLTAEERSRYLPLADGPLPSGHDR